MYLIEERADTPIPFGLTVAIMKMVWGHEGPKLEEKCLMMWFPVGLPHGKATRTHSIACIIETKCYQKEGVCRKWR